jgi:hypothetical protein
MSSCRTTHLPAPSTSRCSSVEEATDSAYDEIIAGVPFTIEHGAVLETDNARFGLFGRYAVRVLDDQSLAPATNTDGLVVAKIRSDDFSLSEMLYDVSAPDQAEGSYMFIPSETVLSESIDDDY